MKLIQVTVQIWSFLWFVFSCNRTQYRVNIRTQSEYWKIQKKALNLNMFHAVKTGILRSSHFHMLLKIGVLKNFAIFTEKYLYWSLFLITFRPEGRYFPGNVPKFLRTAFFIDHLWWLLLNINISWRYNTKL